MQTLNLFHRVILAAVALAAASACSGGSGADPAPPGGPPTQPPTPSPPPPPPPRPAPAFLSGAEHKANMMAQLGISALAPGRNPNASSTNGANYDEAQANPHPNLPDPLTMVSGAAVASAQAWRDERRAEIIDLFEREVYGRVPATAPQISWRVTQTETRTLQGREVTVRRVIGEPTSPITGIDVSLSLLVVNPSADAPLLLMLGPDEEVPAAIPDGHGDLPRQHLLIDAGWGFAMLDTDTIQRDSADGLSLGVIGYSKNGGPRAPDDWGVLRAWAWGASRALDFLRGDPDIEPASIGVEGVSRYGKAAIVAMAFDERFDTGLIASSGKGGTTLYRRNFGEGVSNLANDSFDWMAGNFMKYASADPGALRVADLPVDSHQLIALCAPRPVFISVGIPAQGDALWIDQMGTFMATVAASPVYDFLGVEGLLPMPGDTSVLPPVNTGLLDGQLAWRQHDGGHTDRPNISFFTAWEH